MYKHNKNEGNAISFNYNEDTHEVCMQATLIADYLQTNVITPMHIFWAIVMNKRCPIHSYFAEGGLAFDSLGAMGTFFANQEAYEMITKEEYPFVTEEENTETENIEDVESENDTDTDTVTASEEEISEEEQKFFEQLQNGNVNIYINLGNMENKNPSIEFKADDFEFEFSETLQEIFQKTAKNCLKVKQNYIDMDNLFYQLLSANDEVVTALLHDYFGFDFAGLLDYMEKNCKIFADSYESTISIPKALRNCCTVLNEKYTKSDKCDILGRNEEVNLLWNIFSKKTKKNAILIGEPGVGKTAIMEALTMQIVKGTCPKKFRNHYVVELSVTGMVAGTKYRGEFEQKMEHLIAFLENTDNVILYVDEIHQMLGAGSSSEGTADMSGSLKPILARDNVIFVGATTTNEYNHILSRDGAFKRRFELVKVEEPKHNEVKGMIRKRVNTLSKYHGVTISEEMLDRVIILAYAFNQTTANPDKTIDLLDRSMARASICKSKKLTEEHVQAIFAKSFEEFANQSMERNTSTAYHEAGHYVALRVLEHVLHYEPILVSIVPHDGNGGVTWYEHPKYRSTHPDKEYIYANIMLDLAGRAAQYEYTRNFDAGASSDLRSANELIEQMLTEFGMYEDLQHLVLPYNVTNVHEMSDDMLNELRRKKEKILKEVYEKTTQMVLDNEDAINRVVDLLLEKKIATAAELDAAYRG